MIRRVLSETLGLLPARLACVALSIDLLPGYDDPPIRPFTLGEKGDACNGLDLGLSADGAGRLARPIALSGGG